MEGVVIDGGDTPDGVLLWNCCTGVDGGDPDVDLDLCNSSSLSWSRFMSLTLIGLAGMATGRIGFDFMEFKMPSFSS